MAKRVKLDLSYDGTDYSGWQSQPSDDSVQQAVERALGQILSSEIRIFGSGRTDQGVHARQQVAHADLDTRMPGTELRRALNAILPDDIRIQRVTRAPAGFDARKAAREKEYRYLIWNDEIVPPFLRRYRTHVRDPLDTAAMQDAAGQLVGRHDFAAFTANPNRPVESTIRDLRALIIRKRGKEIAIIARGEGFLYRMVRSLAGLLIRVGEGAEPVLSVREILNSRVRTARVPTAPPEGLFLWVVRY